MKFKKSETIIYKMYLLFAYDQHYPEGAPYDFVCKYKTFKESLDQVKVSGFTYTSIYDVMGDEWYIFRTNDDDSISYWMLDEEDSDDDNDNDKLLTNDVEAELIAKNDG